MRGCCIDLTWVAVRGREEMRREECRKWQSLLPNHVEHVSVRVDTDKTGKCTQTWNTVQDQSEHTHCVCVFWLIGFALRTSNYTHAYCTLSRVATRCLRADELKKPCRSPPVGRNVLKSFMWENTLVEKHTRVSAGQNVPLLHTNTVYRMSSPLCPHVLVVTCHCP